MNCFVIDYKKFQIISVSLRFLWVSLLRIKCIQLSTEAVRLILRFLIVRVEQVRGEGPTASSPVVALQFLQAVSCCGLRSWGLANSFSPFTWISRRRQKICAGLCLDFEILFAFFCPGWKDQRTRSWSTSVFCTCSSWFQGLLGSFFWSRKKWLGVFNINGLFQKYEWALPVQTRQERARDGWHRSETSDKWLLHVLRACLCIVLSFFIHSVSLCFLMFQTLQFKYPELKSGLPAHDLEKITLKMQASGAFH